MVHIPMVISPTSQDASVRHRTLHLANAAFGRKSSLNVWATSPGQGQRPRPNTPPFEGKPSVGVSQPDQLGEQAPSGRSGFALRDCSTILQSND